MGERWKSEEELENWLGTATLQDIIDVLESENVFTEIGDPDSDLSEEEQLELGKQLILDIYREEKEEEEKERLRQEEREEEEKRADFRGDICSIVWDVFVDVFGVDPFDLSYRGADSRYIYARPLGVDVRVSDHRQPRGGGYYVSDEFPEYSGRRGDSCIDIVYDSDTGKIDLYIQSKSEETHKVADAIAEKLGIEPVIAYR